ncbi:leucyl aminopeptidase [Azonexus sp.]|uniref:leucyl aminopeptidase n=1 Tax=Azonexus sp. TaxID=1872668 RepID=UPI0039E5C300
MEFSIKSGSPEKQRCGCVIVGVFEQRQLSLPAELLDKASNGALSDILRRGDMTGKAGTTLLLHNLPGSLCERVLLVGLGKAKTFNAAAYISAIRLAVSTLAATHCSDAALFLSETQVSGHDIAWQLRQTACTALQAAYRFEQFKSEKTPVNLRKLTLMIARRSEIAAAEQGLREGIAIGQGCAFSRDLANLPGNVCHPAYLADTARKLADDYGLSCEILETEAMAKLGMHALLAVARGSAQAPRLIVLHYRGGKKEAAPVVLVGKGITFDSGGISLKPGADMDEMKYDMSGAASVLGTLKAAASMALPINLTVIVPAAENMPDGNATRPGDIVSSLAGKSIEILNTDAEGRLILCDALTYAERFKPAVVIDVATLTGACVVALGHIATGLFSSKPNLARALLRAGEECHDRAWQLPLWDDYQDLLKSPFADMANIGGRWGGAITAACFLARFTEKYPWAHLDIAGTAWNSGKDKGATGRPVPLLSHYLLHYSESEA